MHCFNLFPHCLYVIIVSQNTLYVHTTAAIPWSQQDAIDRSNDQVKQRYARDLINFFGDRHAPEFKTGDHSPIIGNGRDQGGAMVSPETWLKLAKHQSSRVMEGATDLVMAPVHWLAHMRDYWYVHPHLLRFFLHSSVSCPQSPFYSFLIFYFF